ncbi:hypothetical protein [Streptomyces macrosporus]|uniref:Integral membrane protein n=1 Tax=Streptomyces macrosporus TaxID=44032 RepID=A0ABN3JHK8_9ACTN
MSAHPKPVPDDSTEPMSRDRDVAANNRTGSWRQRQSAHIAELQAQLDRLKAENLDKHEKALARKADRMLEAARSAVEYRKFRPLREGDFLHWWSGSAVDRVQANIHEAELLIHQLSPADRLRWLGSVILARGIQHLGGQDPRLRILEEQLRRNRNVLGEECKELALGVLHAANQVEESEIARLRSFRNVLLATFIATSVITLLFILSGFWHPDALADKLCFEKPDPTYGSPLRTEHVCPVGMPRGGDDVAKGGDVLLVASLGMTAATLTGAISVRHVQGSASPYMIPVGLLLLRLPIGALSALLGLVLVHGEFIPGLSSLDSSAQIAAWAVAFGIGQEGLTRLIDKQGDKILENVHGASRGFGEPPAEPKPLEFDIPAPGSLPEPSPAAAGSAEPRPRPDRRSRRLIRRLVRRGRSASR